MSHLINNRMAIFHACYFDCDSCKGCSSCIFYHGKVTRIITLCAIMFGSIYSHKTVCNSVENHFKCRAIETKLLLLKSTRNSKSLLLFKVSFRVCFRLFILFQL